MAENSLTTETPTLKIWMKERKGIKNNLKKLNVNLEELKINPLARAEELSIEEFIVIFKASRV